MPVALSILSGEITKERELIASNIDIDDIPSIVSENFNQNEPVYIHIKDAIYTDIFGRPLELPPEGAQNVFSLVAENLDSRIFEVVPDIDKWDKNIKIVTNIQNNVFIKYRAKSSVVNIEDSLVSIFKRHRFEFYVFSIDPIGRWIKEIDIYKYTEEGVKDIEETEKAKQGFFDRLLDSIGDMVNPRNTFIGVPNTLWVIAAIMIIPELFRRRR